MTGVRAWFALCLLACSPPAPPAEPRAVPPPDAAAPATDGGAIDATIAAPARIEAGSPIARADLEADVALLREAFEALHPGLDRYATRAEREAAYARILDDAGARPTLASTYLALARFAATLRCGHTYVNPHNQSDAVQAALFAEPRLPFLFRWIAGEMIVTRALAGDARLAPGTAITAIDGRPAREVLAALLPLARADGGNDAKRVALLGAHGVRFEAFDVLAPWVFPRGTGPFVLDVRNPDGTTARLEVAPMTAAAKDAAAGAAPPAKDAPAWQLELLDARTAYVRMPTWTLYDRTWDWKAAIDRDVAALVAKRARTLIVDLRGNEGGLDVGQPLVRHLIGKPLAIRGAARIVRYRSVPDALRPHLDTWDQGFLDWGDAARPRPDGRFDLGDAADEVLAPLAPRFRGRVIVLVDASNSSATFQFAQLVQRHGLATIVGEPTGGNRRGINGGAFFFLRLPRTGLEVDLPLVARFPDGGDALPDAGVVPDVRAPVAAADLARGHDAALAAARALAASPTRRPRRASGGPR